MKNRAAARRALDRKIALLDLVEPDPPPRGWVRAIRDAIGMSSRDLAERLGVSQASVVSLEASERSSRIQLDTLERAADAMGCELVYVLRPRDGGRLEQIVRERAGLVAMRDLGPVAHTMALEDQAVQFTEVAEFQRQVDALVDSSGLWRDEP